MKLMKYTFRTPLFGSIEGANLLIDTDARIDLSPQQMARLYDNGPELSLFLTENSEDLTFCVPEELQDVILRAEFGDFAILGGKMWLMTRIWVEGNLTDTGIGQIQDWIAGQMSDGWGEGLEQTAWMERQVEKPVLYFDEWMLDFEEDRERCEISYYVNPWTSGEFYIYLDDCEEVEEDVETEVVASITLPFHQRKVTKVGNELSLKIFLRKHNQEQLIDIIQEHRPTPASSSVYLVTNPDGPSGEEILPKWVHQSGAFCAYYDMETDQEVRGYQLPVAKAVSELLK